MRMIKPCAWAAVAIAVLLFPQPGLAEVFQGSVLDVFGKPIAAATLTINEQNIAVAESGEFTVDTENRDTYQLLFSAPGHFPFIQTLSRADRPHGDATNRVIIIPPVILVPKKDDRRLLVFAGDTMMGRRFVEPRAGEPALVQPGSVLDDMKSLLQHVRPYLQLADFASVNLETQLSASAPKEALPKSVTFYTHTDIVAALKWAGVDYVALGNNHTFDYRDKGLEQTLTALQRAGIAYSGAGIDDESARAAHIANVAGRRLDLLSYVGWPGTFEPNQVAGADKGGAALGTPEAIAEDLDRSPDESLQVLQYHSGLEYESEPPLAEETQLKRAVDKGADLAIGHHSHVLQGLEIYRDKLLAYSLGNFVFDQYLPATQSGMLLFAWYDGDRFFRAEIVPLHINGYVPTPATGNIRYDILQRLSRLSGGEHTCLSRSGEHLVVAACTNATQRLRAQELRFDGEKNSGHIVHLKTLGADPLDAVSSVATDGPYRLGLDLLRRGEFEYTNLFGTVDRTWVEHPQVAIIRDGSNKMRISLSNGEAVNTGMKVFTRVFTRSNPATMAAEVSTDGCADLKFSLQRRPIGMGFEDALTNGPVNDVGRVRVDKGITDVALHFQLPRTSTLAIRLLMSISQCEQQAAATVVHIDDLAMVEWQTPWFGPSEPNPDAATTQATHIQVRL